MAGSGRNGGRKRNRNANRKKQAKALLPYKAVSAGKDKLKVKVKDADDIYVSEMILIFKDGQPFEQLVITLEQIIEIAEIYDMCPAKSRQLHQIIGRVLNGMAKDFYKDSVSPIPPAWNGA